MGKIKVDKVAGGATNTPGQLRRISQMIRNLREANEKMQIFTRLGARDKAGPVFRPMIARQ